MTLIFRACNKWVEDRAQVHGAALAFYSLFSLGPFLVILVSLAGWLFGSNAIEGQLEANIQEFVGVEAAKAVQTLIVGANTHMAKAAIFGVVVLIFAASGVFSQLEDSLNLIWRSKASARNGFVLYIRSKLFSFLLVFILGIVLILSFTLSAMISALTRFDFFKDIEELVSIVDLSFSFLIATLVFSSIFKWIPSSQISYKAALIGGVLTTFLIFVGKYFLELYFQNANIVSAYGITASLVILLLWVYYSTQIFLFGAEVAYFVDNK